MSDLKFTFVTSNLTDEQKNILWPKRQSSQASGLDLVASNLEPIVLEPGCRELICTGIAISLPVGLEAQVRSRSGLSLKHGLMVLNSPGTIDSDYRGEIKVVLANMSKETFTVNFGMRIAQLVIAPVNLEPLMLINELGESLRGEQGFGSTGLGR